VVITAVATASTVSASRIGDAGKAVAETDRHHRTQTDRQNLSRNALIGKHDTLLIDVKVFSELGRHPISAFTEKTLREGISADFSQENRGGMKSAFFTLRSRRGPVDTGLWSARSCAC
jgi:hypothetical protein